MKRPNIFTSLVVVLLAITLPYLFAMLIAGREYVFTGLLLNPIDGASYLAKMREGWDGAWKFTLAYTPNPGEGAYLFLYYLFLGHMARWLGVPIIFVYHLARLVGAVLLLQALLSFYDRVFAGRPDLYRLSYWLTVIGSGMGWLIVFLGPLPTDFWVAEAYPFLAMLTNPHFPLGLALTVWAFLLLIDEQARYRRFLLLLIGLLLALIMQFALVVVLVIGAAWAVWTWVETRRLHWLPLVWLGLLGGPYLLYQYWVVTTDPILAGWTAQNLTPTPPIWDFLLSFSPALLLALPGAYCLYQTREHPARRLLIAWFVLGIVLVYVPFSLQRRFMLGFYIPAAALAAYGLDYLRARWGTRSRWLAPALIGLALPTNLFLLVMGLFGALGHSPALYLTQPEAAALNWIDTHTPADALVLAAPETGQWIPAMTGRRVIYGHPFETLHAAQAEQQVTDFFRGQGKADLTSGPLPSSGLLANQRIDYLFYGPREQALGGRLDLSGLPKVYTAGPVQIYQVQSTP